MQLNALCRSPIISDDLNLSEEEPSRDLKGTETSYDGTLNDSQGQICSLQNQGTHVFLGQSPTTAEISSINVISKD
jgi:hypothetical protein